jgi:hypothetical protein
LEIITATRKGTGGTFMATTVGNPFTSMKGGEVFISMKAGEMFMDIMDGGKLTLREGNLLFAPKDSESII